MWATVQIVDKYRNHTNNYEQLNVATNNRCPQRNTVYGVDEHYLLQK
jgi:hypothetical protein